MQYLNSTKTHNVFELDCPGCGTTGEVGVPKASGKLVTHECGAQFIQRQPRGLFAKPTLVVVTGGR